MNRDRLVVIAALADTSARFHLPPPQAVKFVANRPTVIAVRLADYALWTRALDPSSRAAETFTTDDGTTHYYHVGNLAETDVPVRITSTLSARHLVAAGTS